MKKEKLLRCIALTFAATVMVNIANAQKNQAERQKNFAEKGSFFVKQSGPGKESGEEIAIYGSDKSAELLEDEENAAVKYIERLAEQQGSLFAQSFVKNYSGKNYLHWVVRNDSRDGIFVVERSEDGNEFKAIGFKNRIGTSVPSLSYYFQDESAKGSVFYRILAIGEDGSYKYSDILKVEEVIASVRTDYY